MVSANLNDLRAIRVFNAILKSLRICNSILIRLRKRIAVVRHNSYLYPKWENNLLELTTLLNQLKDVQSPMRALVSNIVDNAGSSDRSVFKIRRGSSYRSFERHTVKLFSRWGLRKKRENTAYLYVEFVNFVPFVIAYGKLLIERFLSIARFFISARLC